MKAAEYAERLKAASDKPKCTYDIIREILLESQQIMKERGIKRGTSLLDVFDELEDKFLAVIRRSGIEFVNNPRIPFRFVFKKSMPETYEDWLFLKCKRGKR